MPKFISDEEMNKLESKNKRFISDSEMEEMIPSKTESALRGLAQGGTLGFSDEIVGGVEAAYNKLKGEQTPYGDLYKKYRDESRAANFLAQQENPKSFTAGEIGGAIGTSFIPGLNVAKGASLASAAGKSALLGGLQATGSTNEDIASMEALKDIASGAAIGGSIGAIGQGIANKIGKRSTSEIADELKDFAELQSAKAQGLERATRKKLGEEASKAVGRQGLDEGVISFLGSADDMIEKNKAIKDAAMAARKGAYESIDEAAASTFNPLKVSEEIESSLGNFNRESPLNRAKLGQLEDTLQALKLRGKENIPMSEAQKLVEELGSAAKFDQSRATGANEIANSAYGKVREAINQSAEDAAKATGIEDLANKIRTANKQYSIAKDADVLLANKFARDANKSIGLTDTITAVGNPVLLPFKKAWESYGNQSLAIGFDKLGDLVKSNPQAFGKFQGVLQNAAQRGPQALGAAHFILQQKSPEYREQLKQFQEE